MPEPQHAPQDQNQPESQRGVETELTTFPIPDGIGLPLEKVRELLISAHKTVVDERDPILLVATLLNAYLEEISKLHARHGQGMTRLLADKTDAYVLGVREATDKLASQLAAASVEGLNKVFAEHMARLHTFKANLIWLAVIVGGSALLNIITLVLRR